MAGFTASRAVRQYAAGIISTLAVASSGATYMYLEPLTTRMTRGEGVAVTREQMSWLMAMVEAGAIISPVPSGYLAERYGRKLLNWSIGPICLLAWLLLLLTKNLTALFLVRILQGVAGGIAFTINPLYTAEISDPGIRGAISGIFQVAFYAGCTLTYIIGPYLSYDWFIIASMPLPILFTVTFVFFPESPYWLLKKNREDEARRALSWLRPDADIDKDLEDMKQAVAEDLEGKTKLGGSALKTLLFDRYERKAFIILQIVCFTKFLSGMPTIIGYATERFSVSKNFLTPSEMSILLGVMLTCIGALSAVLSDRVGRKTLLLWSCYGTFAAHLLTGTYYYFLERTSVNVDSYVWVMYFGIIMYCLFSDIGMGPLLQTLQAEMFGNETRELAGSITEALAAILCFFIILFYQPINDNIGIFFNFYIYGLSGLIGGILLTILMFETAGKEIGRMQDRENNQEDTKI